METFVDVLIIGAGPAGLALANWFRNSDIRVLLIEKRPHPTLKGQAEGLKSTTVEILESMGIGKQVHAELHRLEEIAIWATDAHTKELKREQVMQDKVEELGKPRECMLQQSRCEQLMIQNLQSSHNIQIWRYVCPTSLSVEEGMIHSCEDYPITVQVEHESSNITDRRESSTLKVVRSRYLVGCDGARSWTRSQLGVKLEGDLTDSVFGVMDFQPRTNFPDIRKVCYLKAANGTILLVPRSNKEVRMYIPVESGSELSDPKDVTLEMMLAAARKMMAPFSLDMASCAWWSAYRVGQRVGDHFDAHNHCCFLAGDAVHTHSPKAGQGMNTSIQDAYNLGWKLRLVLSASRLGNVLPSRAISILSTYASERQPVAQDLIAFDRGYLKLFSSASSSFDSQFVRAAKFTTGLSIRYPPSALVQLPPGSSGQHPSPSLLKADLVPGKRLPDFQVVAQCDATTTWMHARLQATGAFRVLAFAGDVASADIAKRLHSLGAWLADHREGLGRLTSGGNQAHVEVLVVHCAERASVELMELHDVFRPWDDEEGYDYWRVFADGMSAHEGHGRVYERLDIDREKGCIVVVRPDGYIGMVTSMEDRKGIKRYFDGIVGPC